MPKKKPAKVAKTYRLESVLVDKLHAFAVSTRRSDTAALETLLEVAFETLEKKPVK